MRKNGLPGERVIASIVWLLDKTLIMVGNANYANENNSFGLTTLRDRHASIKGSALRFAFRGKSGKKWVLRINDRRIAKVVKGVQDLPGQHLFQYLDEDGSRKKINSQDVNDYIRRVAKADFSSKHFRTWGGTVRAAKLLSEAELPQTKRGAAIVMNEAMDAVAARLGNTRGLPDVLRASAGNRGMVRRPAGARACSRAAQAAQGATLVGFLGSAGASLA